MKVDIALTKETVTVEGERLEWVFVDGRVDIFSKLAQVATYRLDQVLWVRLNSPLEAVD
jgi:hypothetical protein